MAPFFHAYGLTVGMNCALLAAASMVLVPRFKALEEVQAIRRYHPTAVGMFGHGAGWGIPPAIPTLMMTVGGIGEKPGVVDRHPAVREYLCFTISLNHEIIDGATAACFTGRLKDLIESGYGLPETVVASELVGTEKS